MTKKRAKELRKHEKAAFTTEKKMWRKRNRIKYGLDHAKMRVRISTEDDQAKVVFLDGLKTETPVRSRSYLMSRGMWAELAKLDAEESE